MCPCVTTGISHWKKTHDFHMQGFLTQGNIVENPTRIKEEIIEFYQNSTLKQRIRDLP